MKLINVCCLEKRDGKYEKIHKSIDADKIISINEAKIASEINGEKCEVNVGGVSFLILMTEANLKAKIVESTSSQKSGRQLILG